MFDDYIGRHFSGKKITSKEVEMGGPWKSPTSKFDIYYTIFER
jgi:hypothetical protein